MSPPKSVAFFLQSIKGSEQTKCRGIFWLNGLALRMSVESETNFLPGSHGMCVGKHVCVCVDVCVCVRDIYSSYQVQRLLLVRRVFQNTLGSSHQPCFRRIRKLLLLLHSFEHLSNFCWFSNNKALISGLKARKR